MKVPSLVEKEEVYVVSYSHKHGEDVSVYDSEKAATFGALEIVREWRDDFGIDDDITDEQALEQWCEYTSGCEDITINQSRIASYQERELDELLTTEMNPTEWNIFRFNWINEYARGLIQEAGWEREDAKERAELDFERYCGQEGWTERDERIAIRRDHASNS